MPPRRCRTRLPKRRKHRPTGASQGAFLRSRRPASNLVTKLQVNDFNEQSRRVRAAAGGPVRAQGSPRPGGRKEPDGPPDLDQMWHDFIARLNRVLGGKRGAPGQPPDQRRAAQLGLGIIIGVLVAAYVGSGLFVVPEGQTGVVLRLGRLSRTVGAGVHWHAPYPLATSQIVDTAGVQTVEVGQGDSSPPNASVDAMVTRDGGIVDVHLSVRYRIASATDYLFHTSDPERLVGQAAQAAARAAIGAQTADAAMHLDRAALQTQLAAAIQRTLDQAGAGLTVTSVTVKGIELPARVQSAAAAVTKAREGADAAKRAAQAYAADLLPRARGDAAKLADDAQAYAQREAAQAQGDADRFNQIYAQYVKAPAVVRERLYLDTMQQIYSTATKVYVGKGNHVLYLPLGHGAGDGAQPASGAQAASAPDATAAASADAASATAVKRDTDAAASAAAAAGSDPQRSRDALRSRDRDATLQ